MNPKTRILLVGGGTGGHFYPLMSLAEELRAQPASPDLYYMGPDPYDRTALEQLGIRFVSCPAGKQRRYASILNIFDLFKVAGGILIALYKLFMIYPDVVVSKGGYTSVPVVLAAWLLRIPIVVHESDTVPGKANRLGARFARLIAVSYPDTVSLFAPKTALYTGIPLRRAVVSDTVTPLPFPIEANAPTILILGGSQGAERVNALILESLPGLLTIFDVIHQTGTTHFERVRTEAERLVPDSGLRARYHVVPFLSAADLNSAFHHAHLVISRAGSTSIHEIAVHGKPAIIIPIPEDVSHDQRTNAYTYARSGAAVVLEEKNLHPGLLQAEIERIMRDHAVYGQMAEAAHAFAPKTGAETLATLISELSRTH
jgi:UDP-N-acetylglucosamine--N-acetylmuramyl-(pentapeptide) pyrophosphoryl-undecaprenol N-acetylglucosamine transferase